MKKALLLSACYFVLSMPIMAIQNKYKNKEISLVSFTITIHSDTKKVFDSFESQFPSTKNQNADKIIAKIKEQTWGTIVDILQREIGMNILPINTFGDKVSYDSYGFPDVNVSKAQRKGYSKYYMKIDMQIGPVAAIQYPVSYKAKKDTTSQSGKLKAGEIKPVVTITLTTYPDNGLVPLDKFIGVAEADKIWTDENVSILDGLINGNITTDLSNFMSLINEAVNDLSINMLIE